MGSILYTNSLVHTNALPFKTLNQVKFDSFLSPGLRIGGFGYKRSYQVSGVG